MKCSACGEEGAYIGFILVECKNKDCRNFKAPTVKTTLARVHWDVNGRLGCSRVIDLEEAVTRAEEGNDAFGVGSHWVEEETPDGEDVSWIYGLMQ